MADATSQVPEGVPYTHGPWFDALYPSSGVFQDYIAHLVGTGDYGYGVGITAELRDLGQFGFVLPDSEIVPVGLEQVASLKQFATRVLAGYRKNVAQRGQ